MRENRVCLFVGVILQMTDPQRWFIALATTSYSHAEMDDRPELADEVARMRDIFVNEFGYRLVPGVTQNMTGYELKKLLRSFLCDPARSSADIFVFYYTGHGVLRNSELVLPFSDTTSDLTGTGVWAGDLAKWIFRGTVVTKTLIILDTCYSGQGAGDLTTDAISALEGLKGQVEHPDIAIIASARPYEQASSCAFPQAFGEVVRHRASGGHEPQYLPLDTVIGMVQSRTPAWQHARLYHIGETVTHFLPNPRFDQQLQGLDLRAQRDLAQRERRKAEISAHVDPRARGLDLPQENVWLFTGRHAALRELVSHLSPAPESSSGWAIAVTGDPGSGKSSVLARLYTLADTQLRPRVPGIERLPPDTVPQRGAVSRFIHARGLTTETILAGLAEAAGIHAETVGDFAMRLGHKATPLAVIVDAIDEANDPKHLVDTLLAPLAREAERIGLRLLLGTRRHLLPRLGPEVQLLDLDEETYADPESVKSYASQCLLQLNKKTPYADLPQEILEATSAAIAEAARKSFLVALITARSLALRTSAVNPFDVAWRASLPREASSAMRLDLDQRLGQQAQRARDLLLPLAYAAGAGLPWEDLWAPLATMLSRDATCYLNSDIDWLIDQAGFYIIETIENERSTYRLYHEALAEHLRECHDNQVMHGKITAYLLRQVPIRDGRRDWREVASYIRMNLSTHAAKAKFLDDLILDPAYLLEAAPPQLLDSLPSVVSVSAATAAAAYQDAAQYFKITDKSDHVSYLELAAHQHSSSELIARIRQLKIGCSFWRPRWSVWAPQHPHRILRRYAGPISGLSSARLGTNSVILANVNTEVHALDPVSGVDAVHFSLQHPAKVAGMSFIEVQVQQPRDPAPLREVVQEGAERDGRRKRKDEEDDSIFTEYLKRIAIGDIRKGRRPETFPLVVTGCRDGLVRIWDLRTGKLAIPELQSSFKDCRSVSAYQDEQDLLVAACSESGYLRIWRIPTEHLSDRTGPRGHLDCESITVRTNVGLVTETIFLKDGTLEPTLIVAGSAGKVSFLALSKERAAVRATEIQPSAVNVVSAILTDSGHAIVTAGSDHVIRIFDMEKKQAAEKTLEGHRDTIQDLALGNIGFRQNRTIFSVSSDSTVRCWDLQSGLPLGSPMRGHTGAVRAVTIAGRGVITGGDDGTIRNWDVTINASGDSTADDTVDVNVLTISDLSHWRTCVLAGHPGGWLSGWDLESGTTIFRHKKHQGPINAISVYDSSCILTGGGTAGRLFGDDFDVQAWWLNDGNLESRPLKAHTGPVRDIVVTHLYNGEQALLTIGGSVYDNDFAIRIWDLQSLLRAKGNDSLQPVAEYIPAKASPTAATAISVGRQTVLMLAYEDSYIRLIDVATGRPVAQPIAVPGTGITALLTMQLEGHTVAVAGCDNGALYIWDLRPLKTHRSARRMFQRLPRIKELRRIQGVGRVTALCISGQQDLIAARGSHVELGILKDIPSQTIELNSSVTSLALYGSSTLAVGTVQGAVIIDLLPGK
jgi:WD40 repeat protein